MSSQLRSRTLVVSIALAVVVVAAIVAITGSSSNEATPAPATVQQVSEVSVEGAALPVLQDMNADPAVGANAPSLSGESFDGSPVALTPGDGNRYMVVFLAHWCPHCQAEVPRLVEWYTSGEAPAGLKVIGISTAVNDAQPNYPPSQWLTREQWPLDVWPVLVDDASGSAMTALGHAGFPFFVLIEGDGTVVHRHAGELGKAEIAALVAASFPSL